MFHHFIFTIPQFYIFLLAPALSRATLMSPGKAETRICGYICYIYKYIYILYIYRHIIYTYIYIYIYIIEVLFLCLFTLSILSLMMSNVFENGV